MPDLFDKHGGFRKLHSFTLATIVQIETSASAAASSLSITVSQAKNFTTQKAGSMTR